MSSGLIGALVGSFGFRTTYRLTFERIIDLRSDSRLPLPTAVPLTREFFGADVTVRMTSTGSGNRFEATVSGLGQDIYHLLETQKTLVHITLGYADGSLAEVMTGILTEKSLHAGEAFYEARLVGVDYVFDRLRHPVERVRTTYRHRTIGDMARALCALARVDAQVPDDGPELASQAFDDVTPLQALLSLAERAGFSLQAKDGKLWMGNAADLGATTLHTIDASGTEATLETRGASPDAGRIEGRDFTAAGVPALRPGDLVKIGESRYRLVSVTHQLKRDGGYHCSGRAVSPSASHADAQAAGRGSAAQVARQVAANLEQRERRRPAASTGDVHQYTPGRHTATLQHGQAATPSMVTPSTQAPLRSDPVALPDKPVAAPFAFQHTGLVAPVYPKMRALLVHPLHNPNDAVVSGFVWTREMTPPANQAGDWWLCLPTELDGDGLPTGSGCDDLITADGQRVIQVKGLRITIGAGLLGAVGSRPTPNPDESLVVQTDQGARITVKGSRIELTDGSVKLTVGDGQVTIQ